MVENTLRPAYEAWAALAWAIACAWCLMLAGLSGAPAVAFLATAALAVCMAAFRSWQTYRNWHLKVALVGHDFWQIPMDALDRVMATAPDRLWLGRGFEWMPLHTARAEAVARTDPQILLPPDWALKLLRVPVAQIRETRGAQWIHGVEPDEQDVRIPWKHVAGNTLIFGVTGGGKTRLYEVVTYQMVKRRDVLIVIDPKGDQELMLTLQRACERAGRPDAFLRFHPAFPKSSVRFDVTKNWNRPTEVPTRISDLLGAEVNDPFVAFGWRAMNNIVGGMIYTNERPSLVRLRAYLENGAEPLLERCLQKWMVTNYPGWERATDELIARMAKEKSGRGKGVETRIQVNNPRLIALAELYHRDIEVDKRHQAINGLLSHCEHARDHYNKMIQSLLPLLTQLTAEPLDELMSPDYDDVNDPRPIFDSEKIVRGGYVLYMATDALSDPTIASAIAGMTLSDVRAVAGAIYNSGERRDGFIHLLIDEAYEVVNSPLIAMMSKARGAGFVSYLAAQTFNDYIVKFGNSEAKARMVLGNGNNVICLRVRDLKTADYVVESIGDVQVPELTHSKAVGSKTEDGGMEFSANFSTSRTLRATDVFPASLLMRLPDLHYVAALSGGRIYKGRLPRLMQPGEAEL